jgi:hypothetical protein
MAWWASLAGTLSVLPCAASYSAVMVGLLTVDALGLGSYLNDVAVWVFEIDVRGAISVLAHLDNLRS